MDITVIFSIIVLIFSIVVHEVAHGYTAYFLGDPTAKYAGRLTLNPIKHIDLFGSIIIPSILALLPGSFIFGWAKPVPVNTYNLRYGKWGEALVAFAGPFSNIIIALTASFFMRLAFTGSLHLEVASVTLLAVITITNIVLAIFNLMPVPPLDGSRVLYALLPTKFASLRQGIERHGFLYVLIFIFLIWPIIEPVIPWLYRLFTGIPLTF